MTMMWRLPVALQRTCQSIGLALGMQITWNVSALLDIAKITLLRGIGTFLLQEIEDMLLLQGNMLPHQESMLLLQEKEIMLQFHATVDILQLRGIVNVTKSLTVLVTDLLHLVALARRLHPTAGSEYMDELQGSDLSC